MINFLPFALWRILVVETLRYHMVPNPKIDSGMEPYHTIVYCTRFFSTIVLIVTLLKLTKLIKKLTHSQDYVKLTKLPEQPLPQDIEICINCGHQQQLSLLWNLVFSRATNQHVVTKCMEDMQVHNSLQRWVAVVLDVAWWPWCSSATTNILHKPNLIN